MFSQMIPERCNKQLYSSHVVFCSAPKRTIRSLKWGFWREDNLVPVTVHESEGTESEDLLNEEDANIQQNLTSHDNPSLYSRDYETEVLVQ